jgi:hypothetical protein
MIGHAGFHRPPQPLERALADSTYRGTAEPAASGVVEIGYTIFPAARSGLRDGNGGCARRLRVHDRRGEHRARGRRRRQRRAACRASTAGGFDRIGTCRDDDGSVEVVLRRDVAPTP